MTEYETMMAIPGVEGARARMLGAQRQDIQVSHYGVVARDQDVSTLLKVIDDTRQAVQEALECEHKSPDMNHMCVEILRKLAEIPGVDMSKVSPETKVSPGANEDVQSPAQVNGGP